MAGRLHLMIKCGRVHKSPWKKKGKIGRPYCYVAVTFSKWPNVIWEDEFLVGKGYARSTADRRNGRNPLWQEHIQFGTSEFTNLHISLRDETVFGALGDSSSLNHSHRELGRVVIPFAVLRSGELVCSNTSTANRILTSPNKKVARQDKDGFYPLYLRDKKGHITATIWARLQLQYPFSIVLPPTMRSMQALKFFKMERHTCLILLSIHSVRFLHTPSILLASRRPGAQPIGDGLHVKVEADAQDIDYQGRLEKFCEVSEQSKECAEFCLWLLDGNVCASFTCY